MHLNGGKDVNMHTSHRRSVSLNGGIFGLPCHIRKVFVTFRRNLLSPSSGGPNVSEDAEEIGREELVVCTGRIYTSGWPKLVERNLWFVQNLYFWLAKIGRKELVVCTERIYTSGWPKLVERKLWFVQKEFIILVGQNW